MGKAASRMQHSSEQAVLDQPPDVRRRNYSGTQALALAVVQLVCGAVCFACHIAAVVNGDLFSIFGAGIRGGVLMIIAGGLGICAARKKTIFLIVATMVMSILTSLSAVCIIVFSSRSSALRASEWYPYDPYNPDMSLTRKDCVVKRCFHPTVSYNQRAKESCISSRDTQCVMRVAVNSFLILVGVVDLVAAILATVLCCAATCPCRGCPANPCCGSGPMLRCGTEKRTCFCEVNCGTRSPGSEMASYTYLKSLESDQDPEA